MTFSRAALYRWLERHGIPFRRGLGDLISQEGTQPALWPAGRRVLHLPSAAPLLPRLAGPPEVTLFNPIEALPPGEIMLYIRAHRSAERNVRIAEDVLTSVFGPPTTRTQSNAIDLRWADAAEPFCHIRVLGFPRSNPLNRALSRGNDRHKAIKGAASEASITICPDWAPPLTPGQEAALRSLSPLMGPKDHPQLMPSVGPFGGAFDRAPAPDAVMPQGLWATEDEGFVLVAERGRFVPFGAGCVLSIGYDLLKPAKGPGGQTVSLRLRKYATERSFALASAAYGVEGLNGLAARVAERLGTALKSTEFHDC